MLKAARAAKRAAKAAEPTRLAELRQRAASLCARMPPEFQDWGVVKTRAYANMIGVLRYKAGLKTITSKRLGAYVDLLTRADGWSLEFCQELTQVNERSNVLEAA